MSEIEFDDLDDFTCLLAQYDAELAAGIAPPSSVRFSALENTTLSERLIRAGDCLRLLEELWPRKSAELEDPVPRSVGRFEINRRLGCGGFGMVYLASDPSLRRRIALKVQRPETVLSA